MEFPVRVNVSGNSVLVEQPVVAITYITVLSVAALLGTLGNLLVIASVVIRLNRKPHDHARGYIFICNLACSDMIVTAVINPVDILNIIYGEDLYAGRFGLCRFLASLCVISCVVSLLSIGCIAANRYLYICHHTKHSSIITQRKSVILCTITWLAGVLLDLPSHLSWSRHAFDAKTLKCFWDRNHNYYYTVLFITLGILCPLVCITIMYGRIFVKVMTSKKKVASHIGSGSNGMKSALQQSKMMFVVFVVFAVCWTPYVCVLLLDREDTYSQQLHLFVSMTAHVHASVNFIIYGCADHVIRAMYRRVICIKLMCRGSMLHNNNVHPANEQQCNNIRTTVMQLRAANN